MPLNIIIIDYGLGNLHSVEKAIRFLGVDAAIVDRPDELVNADGVILPGVGAFGDGIKGLAKRGFIEPLLSYAIKGRPLLGICLGMQFLFSESEEFGLHKGLDLIAGRVVHFPAPKTDEGIKHKFPHIGWNKLIKPSPGFDWDNSILKDFSESSEVYFVHSFVGIPQDPSCILAYSEYAGNLFTAAVRKNNIFGCQFHPEKSRQTGIKILENFLKIVVKLKEGR